MAKYLVLFGPPGVGKGTQAERPKTDQGIAHVATGDLFRDNLKRALDLLGQAGWVVRDGKLAPGETGEPFSFEILLDAPTWERISLPYAKNLGRLGIEARVHVNKAREVGKRWKTKKLERPQGRLGSKVWDAIQEISLARPPRRR